MVGGGGGNERLYLSSKYEKSSIKLRIYLFCGKSQPFVSIVLLKLFQFVFERFSIENLRDYLKTALTLSIFELEIC